MDELTRVYHRDCGGHVGYIKDRSLAKNNSMNFYLLNMRHPNSFEKLRIECKKCGKHIIDTKELTLN